MKAKLAYSKAGHDKGHLYVVLKEEDGFVYLADGKTKTCAYPKKKNKCHIQPVYQVAPEIEELIKDNVTDRDVKIKRALKLFSKE